MAIAPRMPPPGRPGGGPGTWGQVSSLRHLGHSPTESPASPRCGWGYSLRELLTIAPGWPSGPWAGFITPSDSFLRRLWLGPAVARPLTDGETAAAFCRMFALPAGRAPVVLKADSDVPDRALTAAFQAAGAATAALYLPSPGPGDAPEHRAAIGEGSLSPPGARPTRAYPKHRFSRLPGPWVPVLRTAASSASGSR